MRQAPAYIVDTGHPNRSISISLNERLLSMLDALHNAYADLARLNGGELDAAGDDAMKMALELLRPGLDG